MTKEIPWYEIQPGDLIQMDDEYVVVQRIGPRTLSSGYNIGCASSIWRIWCSTPEKAKENTDADAWDWEYADGDDETFYLIESGRKRKRNETHAEEAKD